MKRLTLMILALGCVLAVVSCKKQDTAQNTKQEKVSLWVGVWKLDTSKSKLSEAPQQETMQIEAADQTAIKYTIRGTSDEGKQYTETYDGKPDGNAYPVMVNGKQLGKIAFQWQSDHVCTAQGTGPGGATLTETATLADDGKTIIIKSREGKGEEETAVYTK